MLVSLRGFPIKTITNLYAWILDDPISHHHVSFASRVSNKDHHKCKSSTVTMLCSTLSNLRPLIAEVDGPNDVIQVDGIKCVGPIGSLDFV